MQSKFVVHRTITILLSVFLVVCALRAVLAQATAAGQGGDVPPTTGDMGPTVTIQGNPAPPTDVLGELIGPIDENGVQTVIRYGTTVPVTVSATAQGRSAETNRPNKIYEVALYATKVAEGVIPTRPGIGTGIGEAAHSLQRGDASTGVNNCTWTFKWSASAESPITGEYPVNFSAIWNLHFFYSPGWYWYEGEAEDVWENGGYSFWSEPLGGYHCIADAS